MIEMRWVNARVTLVEPDSPPLLGVNSMGIKDQFQDKAERLQREADQRMGQRQDERGDRASSSRERSSQSQRNDERSRRTSSEDDIYDEDTI